MDKKQIKELLAAFKRLRKALPKLTSCPGGVVWGAEYDRVATDADDAIKRAQKALRESK